MLIVVGIWCGCSRPSAPRPFGYYRIEIPTYTYERVWLPGYPYSYEQSTLACVDTSVAQAEPYWIDVVYPSLNARIHCSYKPITGNFRQLNDDAVRFVFDHAIKADAIPEQGYTDAQHRVWGVYYDLEGNTASPAQFFLTDSVHHFFRGALYYNAIPNADSLAPVNEVLRADIHHLIESFRWK